jgi:hypothetical protein
MVEFELVGKVSKLVVQLLSRARNCRSTAALNGTFTFLQIDYPKPNCDMRLFLLVEQQ